MQSLYVIAIWTAAGHKKQYRDWLWLDYKIWSQSLPIPIIKFWLDPVGCLHVFWPLSLATKRGCKATYKRALRQPEENERFYFFKSCYLLTIKSISVGVGRREKFISLRCHAVKKFLRVMPVFWSCRLTSLTTLVKKLYPKTFQHVLGISFFQWYFF